MHIMPFVKWFFFNVVLSLLPVILAFPIIKSGIVEVNPKWHEVVEDGQLFIFSTVLTSSSIGRYFLSENTSDGSFETITLMSLLIVLAISTALFAVLTLKRLRGEEIANSRSMGRASLSCAVVACVLSYTVSL